MTIARRVVSLHTTAGRRHADNAFTKTTQTIHMTKKDELNFEGSETPKAASSEKLKALQAAMDKIEKNFGKGSIMRMGDETPEQVDVIPTGSIGLNVALGVGGYPRGRIIEIYGPESSGKTTLAIHAIAEAQ